VKLFLAGILEIILNLWMALSDAVEDFLDLLISGLNGNSLYVIMGDEDNPAEIPISRLGEFILDDCESAETQESYQIGSYPLIDAIDFSQRPSDKELKNIAVGDKVLLISNNESFWAQVSKISGDNFEGTVHSNPEKNGYQHGETIEFADHHIFQIASTAQTK
jgi:hypothetical protein